MAKVKVKLLRPLMGGKEGSTVEYDEADAKRLEARGAVEIVTKSEPAPENKKAPAPKNKGKK